LIIFLCTGAQKKGRITLFLLILSLSLTDIICAQYIKPFIERVRPSHLSLEGINLLVKKGGKWSMPSNHSANMFAFSVILSYFYNRYRHLLFSLACVIAFSRIYVGVHFPGDVIIGGIIGYMISWFVLSLWIRLKIHELKEGKKWVWYETSEPEFKNN
jgi:undecaprenyl-diphosphatase